MEVQQFLIKGTTYTLRDPTLQEALARVYDTPERLRCMCVRGGIQCTSPSTVNMWSSGCQVLGTNIT